jgi:hypothetical protein
VFLLRRFLFICAAAIAVYIEGWGEEGRGHRRWGGGGKGGGGLEGEGGGKGLEDRYKGGRGGGGEVETWEEGRTHVREINGGVTVINRYKPL